MAAATRDAIQDESGSPFTLPASNDTELDIEVAKIAEEQKRTTGQSEDTASIKARLLAEGFKRTVVTPESVEDDMRSAHESTQVALDAEAKAEPTFDEEGKSNEVTSKKSSKK